MGKIITLINQKGGVGKSTTSHNLASALMKFHNKKVLLIDLDPQGNLSSLFNQDCNYTMFDIMQDIDMEKGIININEKLDIIKSNQDLVAAELKLNNEISREFKLKKKIKEVKDNYDYIIIDCSPSLGLLTINALIATDEVLIPIQNEIFSVEGLNKLYQVINQIKDLNENLKILGILSTMFDKRVKIHKEFREDIEEVLGDIVLKTIIPRTINLANATAEKKDIFEYNEESLGAKAYKELAEEIIKILEGDNND